MVPALGSRATQRGLFRPSYLPPPKKPFESRRICWRMNGSGSAPITMAPGCPHGVQQTILAFGVLRGMAVMLGVGFGYPCPTYAPCLFAFRASADEETEMPRAQSALNKHSSVIKKRDIADLRCARPPIATTILFAELALGIGFLAGDYTAVAEPKPKPAKIRAGSYEAAIDQLFKRMRSSTSALTQQAVNTPRGPVPNERRRRRPPHGRRTGTTGEWPPATRGSPPAPAEDGPGRGPPPRGRVRSRCTSRGARTRPRRSEEH